MKQIPAVLLAAALPVLVGWIDYDKAVKRGTPTYGKEFQGISLRIQTKNVEFEQDMGEEVAIHIKNTSDRTRLTMQEPGEGRRFALYLVVANEDGSSLFSRDLLEPVPDNPIVKEKIPPKASCELLRAKFNEVEVAAVEKYRDGLPYFEPTKKMTNAGWLTPRIYMIKAVLISSLPDKRPDFVAASEMWPIMLLPKSPARMSEDEVRAYLVSLVETHGCAESTYRQHATGLCHFFDWVLGRSFAVLDAGLWGRAILDGLKAGRMSLSPLHEKGCRGVLPRSQRP